MNLSKMKVGQLYYFEWVDATANSSWKSKTEALKWCEKTSCCIKEIGWLIYKKNGKFGFASRICEWPDEEPDFGMLQIIPKAWILAFKEIKIRRSKC